MAHLRFEFLMPADASTVFDSFHYHHWRVRWDSLVKNTAVVGGAPCPFVGAVTESTGGGLLRGLAMRTQFVSFDRPHVAAAAMVGRSFPFVRWAASMRHRQIQAQQSVLIYTYTFDAGPPGLRWLMEPIVARFFNHQTRKRFARLHHFLAAHAPEVIAWQECQKQQNPAT